ncbi:MAG: response regulator [Desulfuromonadaceae bacterium]
MVEARNKVLLADDVELFLELEKSFFQREDVQILVARSGLQAYQTCLSEHPALVLMDLYMPGMDGDEACRLIKGNAEIAHIPVVIVTQGGQSEDLERCYAAGCDDVLLKPINRHLLVMTARKFLGSAGPDRSQALAKLKIRYGLNSATLLTDYSINLSEGGMFLEMENPLSVNTALNLELLLPSLDEPICCRGRVAWRHFSDQDTESRLPAGMGVQFLDLPNEYVYALREFIRRRCLLPQW